MSENDFLDDEVPNERKERSHLVPVDKWPEIKARAAEEAKKDTEDLDVPEPDEEDLQQVGFEATPDEITREETL